MAAALCFAMLAAGLSAARCAAAVSPTHSTSAAAAAKLPPKLAPKLPSGVVLAKVPWKRSSRHPVPEFVPLATLPWANCHVVPLYMPYRPEKTKKWVDPDYNFIMAMCRDKQGNLWLATEGSGIYRYDPSASKGKHWTQFTKQNTHGALANNCIYAITCDNHNRIWAGELNHGISVFNGKQWQAYDIVQNPKHNVLAGPLGDHVFAMKFDRYTDQMWIGTNAGISVYQCSGPRVGAIKHRWRYITQANGLPMNPDAIAFGKGGIIYVGTQCGGLAVGTRRRGTASNALGWSRYQWTVIQGPWHMPLTATGKGLPSNLINAVAVESGGRVVVGTDGGIAFGPSTSDASLAASAVPSPASLLAAPRRSANNLRHSMQRAPRSASHWTFEHGRNFVAKVYGLWHPPVHWQAPPGQLLEQLPTEDHTTVAAWQPNPAQGARAGYLWMGHWRTGLDVWQYNADGKIIQRWHIHEPQVGNYVESLQPLRGNAMAVGCYGKGAFIITLPGESKNAWRKAAPGTVAGIGIASHGSTDEGTLAYAPEPRAARPPSARELTAMANAIRAELINSSGQKQPRIVPLPDDWRTEGSWLGRYGRYWACLFACCKAPPDYVWAPGPVPLHHTEAMGPHHYPGDSVRNWVEWIATANPRVLELPAVYLDSRVVRGLTRRGAGRRESEIDDHGEVYPAAWEGPGLRLKFQIPAGAYTLSFYLYNYNGHTGENRRRDYLASIAAYTAAPTRRFGGRPKRPPAAPREPDEFGPRMVASRVANFWGGAWLSFLVRGPCVVKLRLSRNYSLNTMLAGAMLDPLAQHPEPYYTPTEAAACGPAPRGGAVGAVVAALAGIEKRNPGAYAGDAQIGYGISLRSCVAAGAPPTQGAAAWYAGDCYYHLSMFRRWEAGERSVGVITSRQIEKGLRWDRLRGTYRGIEAVVIRRYAAELVASDKRHRCRRTPAR